MIEENKTQALVYLIILLIVGSILGVAMAQIAYDKSKDAAERRWGGGGPPPKPFPEKKEFSFHFWGSIIFISINLVLLLGLLGIYINTYVTTRSSFMLGLILFISVLAIQSILSLPILHTLFGFTSFGLGVFGVLPHLFETFALIILFILSAD
jgi:hypothetical protein